MAEADKIRELERKIKEIEDSKENQHTKRSPFLITAGILTIIASSLISFLTVWFLVNGIQEIINITILNLHIYVNNSTKIIAGVVGVIAFAFGLSAGITTLKRTDKAFTITSVSILLGSSIAMPLLANYLYLIYFVPIIVLSILSIIFLGVGHNNFLPSKTIFKENETEYRTATKPKKLTLLPIFATIIIIVVIITIIGVFCSYYPNTVIAGIQEKLDSNSLSQSDRWMYNGSLTWWNNQLLTVYQPISNFLMVVDVILIIISVMILMVQVILHYKNK
jgi:hypothetical protein